MLDGKYDHKTLDPWAQALWEEQGTHRFDPDAPGEIYSVDTPPPTVSGSLHIGHVSSYTQAECIVRYKRMCGRNVFYPFGFDTNGIPTERLAEREHKVLGVNMPRAEFVKLCRETSAKYEREFETLWRSLGVSADWTLCYSTIGADETRISQRAFMRLLEKGEVYLKTGPTMWDTETQTAIAQAELESKDQRTKMNDLRFDLVGGGSITIATTRPELLCACVTIFIHPDHPQAGELLGKQAIVPLFEHHVEIRADEAVDPEKGTGVVMCCTFGDKTDVEWFKKHDLELRQAISLNGQMTELAGPEAGLYAKQARRKILERLEAAGYLLKQEEIDNVVSIYERTKREIEFLPTRQWYLKILDKKDALVARGEQVQWHPAHMGKRYKNWVEGLEWDWNISRQRFYGVLFPVWTCDGCGEVFAAPEEWLPILDHDKHEVTHACTSCSGTAWTPDRDVMDTWATSSETPQLNSRWGEPSEGRFAPRPMQLRPQAHDIIRTWAFYTILKSHIHFDDIPWTDVMVAGHVQAPGKKKIGKSLGNAPTDPNDTIKAHGADATRYWALSTTLGNDYLYSEDELKQGRRLCVKVWNAAKLAQGHVADFDPNAPRPAPHPIDTWIRGRLAETVKLATANLDRFEFGIAKGDIERFFWGDLCDNYLEMIKARLYDESPDGADSKAAARAGLYDVMYGVIRLLTPFVPHVCEAVYQALFRAHEPSDDVGRAAWPTADVEADASAEAAGAAAVAVLTALRRWRTEQKIGGGKPLQFARARAHPDIANAMADAEGAVIAAGRVLDLTVIADEALAAGDVHMDDAALADPVA